MARLRRKRPTSKLQMAVTGKLAKRDHSPAARMSPKTMATVTASRRELNKAKKSFDATDKRVGVLLKDIDKLMGASERKRKLKKRDR